jgi:hypothetical protein
MLIMVGTAAGMNRKLTAEYSCQPCITRAVSLWRQRQRLPSGRVVPRASFLWQAVAAGCEYQCPTGVSSGSSYCSRQQLGNGQASGGVTDSRS